MMISPDLWPAVITLSAVAIMFALFVSELYSTETVANFRHCISARDWRSVY
jgi:hypothetical protein